MDMGWKMSTLRTWVITVTMRTVPVSIGSGMPQGEILSDVVVAEDALKKALTRVEEYIESKGFELLDIRHAEIFIPRTFSRDNKALEHTIMDAVTYVGHYPEKVSFGTMLDSAYFEKQPKPWLVETHVKALPSWNGSMPYQDAQYYNNCLVYAVTKETAVALVSDALLTRDFEIHELMRCEIFDEETTKPLYRTETHPTFSDITISTIEPYVTTFLNTKTLTFGDFIFPEDKAESP